MRVSQWLLDSSIIAVGEMIVLPKVIEHLLVNRAHGHLPSNLFEESE